MARKCTICGEQIQLHPSATERARRFGGVPSDYSDLFTEHSTCVVEKRSQEAYDLMRKIAEDMDHKKVRLRLIQAY